MEISNVSETPQSTEDCVNLNISNNEISEDVDTADKLKCGSTTKSRTCLYYYNYGYCKFGNNCKFKHFRKGVKNVKRASTDKKVSTLQTAQKNKQVENQEALQSSNSGTGVTVPKENCRYFKLGDCKKGDKCEYLHSLDVINSELSSLTLSPESQNIPKKVFSSSGRSAKKRTLCYYFKKGLCNKGDDCRYYHNKKPLKKLDNSFNVQTEYVANNTSPIKKVGNENASAARNSSNFRRTFNIFDLSSLTDDAITELRLIFLINY